MQPRAIELRGHPIGSGRFPAICAPLVGRTREKLQAEIAVVAAKRPDILEWRVDFFEGLGDTAQVLEVLAGIKQSAGGIPILFTRRSMREGGERITLSEAQVVELYRGVCASGDVDFIDFEMGNDPNDVQQVREISRAEGVKLILSFHDFQRTPPLEVLEQRFTQAATIGADIAKVAVMPQGMEDVLTLLSATLRAGKHIEIPIVSMSMGRFGAITRMCGWAFGSAMTFAVGEASSAPGQMAIEDVEAALAVLQRSIRPQDL